MLKQVGLNSVVVVVVVGSEPLCPAQNSWKNRLVEPSPNDLRSTGFTKARHSGQVRSRSNLERREKKERNTKEPRDQNLLKKGSSWVAAKLMRIPLMPEINYALDSQEMYMIESSLWSDFWPFDEN